MRNSTRSFGFGVFALLGSWLSTDARAVVLPNRVFISTTGNDANDCSNPLTPCVDFIGALAQVATGGEVIAEATGPYGSLAITKSVTISGPPGVVIYSGHQVTVNAPGATVVLRGMTIDGNGAVENGINVQAVQTLFVEGCVIAGFVGDASSQGNGIYFGSAGNLSVTDTIIRGNGAVGIWVDPSSGTAETSVDHCRLEGNQWGLISDSGGVATIRDSVASRNDFAGNGLGFLAQGGGELNIENCVVANNANGIGSFGAGTVVRVSNATVTDNGAGLFPANGGVLVSRGNNTVRGNGFKGSFTGTFAAD